MRKLVMVGLSALLAGTLLTGCVKMEDSIIVNSDGSCSMSGEISIEKDTMIKTYSEILGSSGSSNIFTEQMVAKALEQQGFTPVTIDGKDYYKIATDTMTGMKDIKCDNIISFYKYLSKNLPGVLYQSENNAISLSETSVVLRMPANENMIGDIIGSAGSAAADTNNALIDMSDSEKILESLKDAVVTYNVTFPEKISKKSSNVTLSEDGKTATVSFPVITDRTYDEYAYCENDIAAEGALNGVTYGSPVTVSLLEGVTATLNGSPVTQNSITCEKTGTYNFKLSDSGKTTETLCFVVDTTAPALVRQKDADKLEFSDFYSILGKGYIAVYDAEGGIKDISIDGSSVISSAALNMKDIQDENSLLSSYNIYSLNTDNFSEGSHSISVSDTIGNKTEETFIIDRTKPSVKGVKNAKTYKKAVTIKFSDKNGIKSAKLNGKTVKSGAKASKKGNYTLKVTDNAGNVQTVKFKIKK